MAQLIFLGSFRLNSNHNYFPIAVVAQTLGILGRSTPIIKEKALFFKTDIRISKKKLIAFLPQTKKSNLEIMILLCISIASFPRADYVFLVELGEQDCNPFMELGRVSITKSMQVQHHQSKVVSKYNRTVPVADGSPAGDYRGVWPVTDNNCV